MIGIHIKSKNLRDLKTAMTYAKNIGCSHIQIFNENIPDSESIKSLLKKNNLQMIVHSPYIINIAAKFDPHSWRMKYLLMEIETSIINGACGFVLHMGKSMDLSVIESYKNMYKTLKMVCKKINKKKFSIFLETTAGQGTELCYHIEELHDFFEFIKNDNSLKNIKICLDTCHLFCAGYDLKTIKGNNNFITKFNKLIGINKVGLLHINDSLNDIGTRKDRHANIGEGFIGTKGLRYFYQFFSKLGVPAILETPIGDYSAEIKLLTN